MIRPNGILFCRCNLSNVGLRHYKLSEGILPRVPMNRGSGMFDSVSPEHSFYVGYDAIRCID